MVDPRRARGRKGIRIDARKLVPRDDILRVSEMPPQVRIHDASAARPESFTDNNGKNRCRKCKEPAVRCSSYRECLVLVFHVSFLGGGIVTWAQKFPLPEDDWRF